MLFELTRRKSLEKKMSTTLENVPRLPYSSAGKNPSAMRAWVQIPDSEGPLEKATHSSTLAWGIHGLYDP